MTEPEPSPFAARVPPTTLYIGQTGSAFHFSARSRATLDAHYVARLEYLRSLDWPKDDDYARFAL